MYFKRLKLFVYTIFGNALFIVFLSTADEDKIQVKFDKIFPTSVLENFHKLISKKKCDLQDINLVNNKEEYIENSLDSILDFHVCIYLLRDEIKRKKSYFKEDFDNLIYFISQINCLIESNLIDYTNSKKEVIKVLFDKAISKLSSI
ncbi:MAG: hypothetical protein P4L22_07860 [Candidatus Babeliales bacterium]|nr:hypothetical protein [Candidatus Babeliales bacterium]